MKPILFMFLICLSFSCQQEDELIDRAATIPSSSTESSNEDQTQSDPIGSTENSNFYQMDGDRPAEVCGEEGFRYLWDGYLLKECGTCHNQDNPYGVTEFAVRGDFDSSFNVMTTIVDLDEFLEAVRDNSLCIKCNLLEDDPLLEDVKSYLQSPSQCR